MHRSNLRILAIALLAVIVSASPYHSNASAAQHAEAPAPSHEGTAAAPGHGDRRGREAQSHGGATRAGRLDGRRVRVPASCSWAGSPGSR